MISEQLADRDMIISAATTKCNDLTETIKSMNIQQQSAKELHEKLREECNNHRLCIASASAEADVVRSVLLARDQELSEVMASFAETKAMHQQSCDEHEAMRNESEVGVSLVEVLWCAACCCVVVE